MDEVLVGIAGTGYMGRTYAECLTRDNEGARLSNLTGTSVRFPLPRLKGGFQFDSATVPRDRIPG